MKVYVVVWGFPQEFSILAIVSTKEAAEARVREEYDCHTGYTVWQVDGEELEDEEEW
jgi:hypothetical protein